MLCLPCLHKHFFNLKVRIKTLQSDLEAMKTSNRNYQQKAAQEGGELIKLKQEKENWAGERRTLTSQANRASKEAEEWRAKADQLAKTLRAKETDLAKSLELLKQSNGEGAVDSQAVLQLTSLVQLETELADAQHTIEKLNQEIRTRTEEGQRYQTDRAVLLEQVTQYKASAEAAAKEKHEAETRLEVPFRVCLFSVFHTTLTIGLIVLRSFPTISRRRRPSCIRSWAPTKLCGP